MPATRLTMRKIRETLRLRLEAGLPYRQISASTKTSIGAIQKLLSKADSLGLTWPLPDDLDDAALARMFYPSANTSTGTTAFPEWTAIHLELKHKGMTKLLLWEEYTQQYPNRCYSYSQFCDRYRHWLGQQRRSMRQVHKAGEKLFVDYAGQTVPVVCPLTGVISPVQVFVATLGASGYTYAEATATQTLPDWLGSHVRAFEFFGGLPELVVPDNLKSAVSRACRYDPDVNPSYQQLAEHYRVVVIPARPRKPKDKSKAELSVQLVERWILARLRKHTFFCLAELNRCIHALLEDLNSRAFKRMPGSRKEAFEQLDKPVLKALPAQRYEYQEIKTVKVNIDYHIQYDQHLYSVPHQYVGERLELHASRTLVRIYMQRQLIATHPRRKGTGMSTDPLHMPERHSKHLQWTPQRLKHWASQVGPDILMWVTERLETKTHPEQAYRVCLGLLSLSRQYPSDRLNASCRIANREGLGRLKQVRSILQSNRDQLQQQLPIGIELPQDHENVRGPGNFH
jgi:transposase